MRLFIIPFIFGFIFNADAQRPHYIDPLNLSWYDYTGQIDYSKQMTAYTSSFFLIGFTDPKHPTLNSIEISIQFEPQKSFVDWQVLSKKSLGYQAYLFNHERLHYYVTIIYGKKFKNYLIHNKIQQVMQLEKLRNQFAKEMQDYDDYYDAETLHSYDTLKQKLWDGIIMRGIDSLKNVTLDMPH